MELKQAQELAKPEMEKADIVVVTSDKAIYLLNEPSEIEVIKAHAERNKLICHVVKEGKTKVEKPSKKENKN